MAEARDKRELAGRKREEAQKKLDAARRMQRLEEMMDGKADTAQEHSEQLSRDRQDVIDKIAEYHRRIDGCSREMSRYKDLDFCTNPSSSRPLREL